MKRSLLFLIALTGCAHEPVRGTKFWLALREGGFSFTGDRVAVLRDSVALVDEVDPRLRDDVGYGLAVAWLYRDTTLAPDVVSDFTRRLSSRARSLEGPTRGRSFAVLSLSIVAAAELKRPALSQAEFDGLVELACGELTSEQDLRGYELPEGWLHATAHTADLLKFLARDSRLGARQQALVFEAISRRLTRGPAFTWGEDERLAAALRSLVSRPDFEPAPLRSWLASLPPAWQRVWAQPSLPVAEYVALQNTKQVLRALVLGLDSSPPLGALRETVLAVLLELQ